jgi:hypothetical protein
MVVSKRANPLAENAVKTRKPPEVENLSSPENAELND